MSILMDGKDCRSCRLSFTDVVNHLPRRRCAELSMWVRDNDYCKRHEARESEHENIDNLIESNPEFKRVLGLLRSIQDDRG